MRKALLGGLIFLGASAYAHDSSGGRINCQSKEGTSKVFRKFQGISGQEIRSDCTYGGRKGKYTSSCVSAYKEMRNLASDYIDAKNDFCEKMKACGDKLKNCPDDGGDLRKQIAEAHEKAASILKQGRAKLHKLVADAKEDHERCRSDKRSLDHISSEHKHHRRRYGGRRHSDSSGTYASGSDSGFSVKEDSGEAKEAEELGSSGISGLKGEAGGGDYGYVVDADAIGAKDLEEYHAALPRLLKKQETAIAEMEAFEGETQSLETEHSKAIQVPPVKATTSLTAVRAQSFAKESEQEKRKRLGYQAVTGELEPKVLPESHEHEALQAFEEELGRQPDSLRDAIRREIASKGLQDAPAGGKTAGALAASAAADLFSGKNLEAFDSEDEDIPYEPPGARSGPRLNVRAAVEDMEGQLAELDRSRGILEESSVSLFERVREALRRSFSSGRLGSNR